MAPPHKSAHLSRAFTTLLCGLGCGGPSSTGFGQDTAAEAIFDDDPACQQGPDGTRLATLQAAVDQAPVGATVQACGGEHRGPLVVRRDVVVVGPATLIGGPGPAVHVIDGSLTLRDLDITGGTGAIEPRLSGDTHGGAIAAWEATSLELERVRVQGGQADWGGSISGPRQGPLTVRDSTIQGGVAAKVAGCVWMRWGAVEDTVVEGCSADYGGALAVRGTAAWSGVTTLGNTRIENSAARVQGGGLLVSGPGTTQGGVVVGNESQQGGGILVSDATGVLQDTVVEGNVSTVGGGGVLVRQSQAVLRWLEVRGNTVTGEGLPDDRGVGGGVWVTGDATTSLVLEDTVVEDNTAAWGGGVIVAGTETSGPTLTLVGGRLGAHTAREGGGAAVSQATLVLDGTVVEDNLATEAASGGAAVAGGLLRARGLWQRNTPADVDTAAGPGTIGSEAWTVCDDDGCRPEY